MPLRAEELSCLACELQIVFENGRGELMIEMVAIDTPEDLGDSTVREYQKTLAVESAGDMYLPRFLPTLPQRADVVELPDGNLGIRYSNMVSLEDVVRSKR